MDYYMSPFPAPGDAQVKAAISIQLHNEGAQSAINQAPHQFEIWRLAKIDTETGHITESREYLCDCSSIIRTGIRSHATGRAPETDRPSEQAAGRIERTAGQAHSHAAAEAGIPSQPPPAEAQEGAKAE